jgi:hypothetical protein
MNKVSVFMLSTAAVLGLALGANARAEEQASPAAGNGLALVEKDKWSEIYANPEVDWSTYTQVELQAAPVSFRRNWQRDQNRGDPFKVDAKDMEKIRKSLSDLFNQVLTEELTRENGYTMATEAGEQVMSIQPSIVDLDVVAPDTMSASRSRQYADSSGRMTARLEIYDSVTGELLATVSQRLEDPRRGYTQWTTSASNRADAERLLRRWAKDLRQKLDKARSSSPASGEALK